MNVVEIVPPYVESELDLGHRDVVAEMYKGAVPKGKPADEYAESVVKGLRERTEDGKIPQIIADGFPRKAADAWIEAYGPMMRALGV